MSLTLGTGPLGIAPGGVYNREPEREGLLYLEPFPRRIRGAVGTETVVDARSARMLHEQGRLPIHLFPRDEVRGELVPGDEVAGSANKGPARRFHLRVGAEVRENAAWEWHDPPPGAPPLAGLIAFEWDALDHWFEEDEELFVHARDPYHRVDALATDRHVRVSVDGEPIAETIRAVAIFETGLPPRWYIPQEDVRDEALAPSDTRTGCAYKGFARYWSVRVGDRVERDVAWCYDEPHRDVAPVAGMVAFFNERVDIDLDGERQDRPLTPWSPDWPGEREEEAGPPVVRPDR